MLLAKLATRLLPFSFLSLTAEQRNLRQPKEDQQHTAKHSVFCTAPACDPLPEARTRTTDRHTCAAHEKLFYSLELVTRASHFSSVTAPPSAFHEGVLPEFPAHPQSPARCEARTEAPHGTAGGTPATGHISAPLRRCRRAQLHSQQSLVAPKVEILNGTQAAILRAP